NVAELHVDACLGRVCPHDGQQRVRGQGRGLVRVRVHDRRVAHPCFASCVIVASSRSTASSTTVFLKNSRFMRVCSSTALLKVRSRKSRSEMSSSSTSSHVSGSTSEKSVTSQWPTSVPSIAFRRAGMRASKAQTLHGSSASHPKKKLRAYCS